MSLTYVFDDLMSIMRVFTRAFARNYSKCMVRLNTQTEFAVILFEKSSQFFYSMSKQNKSVIRKDVNMCANVRLDIYMHMYMCVCKKRRRKKPNCCLF